MRKIYLLAGLLLFGLMFSQTLNAEINEVNFYGSGNPTNFIAYKDKIIFAATDVNGYDIRLHDLSTGHTGMVRNTWPDGSFTIQDAEPIEFRDRIFFLRGDVAGKIQLWETDATDSGTLKIADLGIYWTPRQKMFAATDTHLFVILDNDLWATDGTAAGTHKLAQFKELYAGFVSKNGQLYFSADDGFSGRELWISDGSPHGTRMVADVNSGQASGFSEGPYKVGDNVIFRAVDSSLTDSFYNTDGTADGTVSVLDVADPEIVAAVIGSKLAILSKREIRVYDSANYEVEFLRTFPNDRVGVFTAGNRLYIKLADGALWSSDGTKENTAGFNPTQDVSKKFDITWTSADTDYVLLIEKGNNRTWVSDGTDGNAFAPEIFTSPYFNPSLHIGTNLYLSASRSSYGNVELFKIDLNTKQASLVADIDRRGSARPTGFVELNGDLFFTAYDGEQYAFFKRKKADGALEKIWNPDLPILTLSSDSKENYSFVKSGAKLYFRDLRSYNRGIYRTGGKSSDTEYVYQPDMNPGTADVIDLDGKGVILFTNDYPGQPENIWSLRNSGNEIIKFKSLGAATDTVKKTLAGNIYFIERATATNVLWKTNGTTDGTVSIASFGNARLLDTFGNLLMLAGSQSANYNAPLNELWISGTVAGTAQKIKTLPSDAGILGGIQLDDSYVYMVKNGNTSLDVYTTDGSTSSHRLLASLPRIGNHVAPRLDLVKCGNNIFFYSSDFGRLYKTDGTAAGTKLIKATDSGALRETYCLKGGLYFLQDTDKIYSVDPAGELKEQQIVVTNGAQLPEVGTPTDTVLYAGEDKLYFRAVTEASGSELYTVTSNLPVYLAVNEPKNGAAQLQVKIYPNPVTDVVNLQLPAGHRMERAEILDISGKTVKSLQLSGNPGINIGSLNSGMYIIKIITDKDMFTGKFIKK